ncbi:hypothetical protein JW964_22480 [candidate division KSB1 bacterium]|nr:hypothetical protein [candidate division KSB1 bacterium]
MRIKILFTKQSIITLIIIFGLLSLFCEKKEPKDVIQQALEIFEQQQNQQTLPQATIDYGEIMNTIFALEETIKTNPDDIEARQALLKAAIDTERKKIYAIGEGITDTTNTNVPQAKQRAERAALIDAQRWIMFIQLWQKDISTPSITEKVTGDVPPFRIVQKALLPGDKVYFMIEVNL